MSFSLGRSGVQVGFDSRQMVVHGKASGARALGEEDPLLDVGVKGELERDGP